MTYISAALLSSPDMVFTANATTILPLYDLIGIGFGPANIALAIYLQESAWEGNCLFLERRSGPSWQPQMLLAGSDIQNHPSRDLVTPRNPRSRYTFTNFLFENGRLFEHLNLGLEFPLRREFAEYVVWVANFFADQVAYSTNVKSLSLDNSTTPAVYRIETCEGQVYRARSVVVAPGRTPLVPEVFQAANNTRVFHLTEYLQRMDALSKTRPPKRIVVVGGSQSAVEIILHLRQQHPDAEIINVQRGYGFRLKDTSPFSEHVYFPEFVDYYFNSSQSTKQSLNRHLHYTNYSAADGDVIHQLYVGMYEDRLMGKAPLQILGCTQIEGYDENADTCSLHIVESHTGERQTLDNIDAVVLATGFRNLGSAPHEELCPAILGELYPLLQVHKHGAFLALGRDYSLTAKAGYHLPPIFLNGLCESSHGYGDAGSFSLLSLRSREIGQSLISQLSTLAVTV